MDGTPNLYLIPGPPSEGSNYALLPRAGAYQQFGYS